MLSGIYSTILTTTKKVQIQYIGKYILSSLPYRTFLFLYFHSFDEPSVVKFLTVIFIKDASAYKYYAIYHLRDMSIIIVLLDTLVVFWRKLYMKLAS